MDVLYLIPKELYSKLSVKANTADTDSLQNLNVHQANFFELNDHAQMDAAINAGKAKQPYVKKTPCKTAPPVGIAALENKSPHLSDSQILPAQNGTLNSNKTNLNDVHSLLSTNASSSRQNESTFRGQDPLPFYNSSFNFDGRNMGMPAEIGDLSSIRGVNDQRTSGTQTTPLTFRTYGTQTNFDNEQKQAPSNSTNAQTNTTQQDITINRQAPSLNNNEAFIPPEEVTTTPPKSPVFNSRPAEYKLLSSKSILKKTSVKPYTIPKHLKPGWYTPTKKTTRKDIFNDEKLNENPTEMDISDIETLAEKRVRNKKRIISPQQKRKRNPNHTLNVSRIKKKTKYRYPFPEEKEGKRKRTDDMGKNKKKPKVAVWI